MSVFQLFASIQFKTFLTKVYKVTINKFKVGRGIFCKLLIIKKVYFVSLNFLTEIHISLLVFSPLSTDIAYHNLAG